MELVDERPDRHGVFERRLAHRVDVQVKLLAPLGVVWIAGSLAIIAIARQRPDLAGELMLDPSYFAGVHWYTGLISNLGIMAWTVAAVGATCGWWAARMAGRPQATRMLRGGALLSGFLALDDLLQLHIELLGRAMPLGKPIVELGIAGATAVWVSRNRWEIIRTRAVVLGAAVAALATSVVVDALLDPGPSDWALLLEDGAKFLGVLGWATFFVATSLDIISSIARGARPPAQPRSAELVPAGPSAEDLDAVAARIPAERPVGESGERVDLLPRGAHFRR